MGTRGCRYWVADSRVAVDRLAKARAECSSVHSVHKDVGDPNILPDSREEGLGIHDVPRLERLIQRRIAEQLHLAPTRKDRVSSTKRTSQDHV